MRTNGTTANRVTAAGRLDRSDLAAPQAARP